MNCSLLVFQKQNGSMHIWFNFSPLSVRRSMLIYYLPLICGSGFFTLAFLLLIYPDLEIQQVLHFVHGMLVGLPLQSYTWKVNWCPEGFSNFWSLTCFLSLSVHVRVISALFCLRFSSQLAGVSSRCITRGFLFSLSSNMFSLEHAFLMITRHSKACLLFLIADKVFSR